MGTGVPLILLTSLSGRYHEGRHHVFVVVLFLGAMQTLIQRDGETFSRSPSEVADLGSNQRSVCSVHTLQPYEPVTTPDQRPLQEVPPRSSSPLQRFCIFSLSMSVRKVSCLLSKLPLGTCLSLEPSETLSYLQIYTLLSASEIRNTS